MPGTAANNPLLKSWTAPFSAPPFAEIVPEHFRLAFDAAIAEQKQAIDAIAANLEPPTFDNTITAIERSAPALDRVSSVFFNLAGAHTSDAIQAIERDIAPVLSRHADEINLNPALFARIKSLWGKRSELGLDAEQVRVL